MQIERRKIDEAQSLPFISGMQAETLDEIICYRMPGRRILSSALFRNKEWKTLVFSDEAVAMGICPKRRLFREVSGWEITVSSDGQMRASHRSVPKGHEAEVVCNIWLWGKTGLKPLFSKIDFQSVDLVESPVIIPVGKISDRQGGGMIVAPFYEFGKEFTQRKIKEFLGSRLY